MTTQTETATIENNQYEGDNQNFEQNFSADTGAMDTNLGSAGVGMEGAMSMGQGIPYEAGGSGTFQTTSQGGLVMGVGGGVGDEAQDVTFSTKNIDGTAFGTTKTTTTTTTTRYGYTQNQGAGLTTTSSSYQMGQAGGEGLVMGVGGGVQDDAVDVTYSTNTGMKTGGQGTMTTTTTTTRTQYGLGQTQGQIIQGEGQVIQGEGQMIQGEGAGLIMGVGGGVQDDAVDVTYSSNTGHNLGAAGAKTTTTTTTTRTEYNLGQNQGQIIQGEGSGLVMGVGGGIQDDVVEVTYSSNTGQGLGAAAAKTTTTTTTTETQYGAGLGVSTGVRRSVDIRKYATTKTFP